jgi:hypothetical protein
MDDNKVKKLIDAVNTVLATHSWSLAGLNELHDAISAIELDEMVLTTDGECVKDGDTVWMVHIDREIDKVELFRGKAQVNNGGEDLLIDIESGCLTQAAPDWLIFAHYHNAIAKIDEIMGPAPAIVNADGSEPKTGETVYYKDAEAFLKSERERTHWNQFETADGVLVDGDLIPWQVTSTGISLFEYSIKNARTGSGLYCTPEEAAKAWLRLIRSSK